MLLPPMKAVRGSIRGVLGALTFTAAVSFTLYCVCREQILLIQKSQAIEVVAGDVGEFSITVRNRGLFPVKITSYDTSCSCTSTTALPLEIPALGEERVVFSVATSPKDAVGNVSLQRIRFYSVPIVERLECDVSIRVVGPQ